MTPGVPEISELDLLAYADDRLDAGRRLEVEAYLTAHPDEAGRIADYREQNRLIRERYKAVLSEQVPRRLRSILEDRPASSGRRALHAFAAVLGLLMFGAASWWFGYITADDSDKLESFAERAAGLAGTRGAQPAPTDPTRALVSDGSTVAWETPNIALELRQPDLTPHGYRLARSELVEVGGLPVIRLLYEHSDMRSVSLFLTTRWSSETPEINIEESDGILSTAYWTDGPIIFALSGELGREGLLKLAHGIEGVLDIQPKSPRLHTHQSRLTGQQTAAHTP